MHHLRAELVEGDCVVEGLAAGLEGEGEVRVADGVPLTVHGADGDPELVRVLLRQLGNVLGNLEKRNNNKISLVFF